MFKHKNCWQKRTLKNKKIKSYQGIKAKKIIRLPDIQYSKVQDFHRKEVEHLGQRLQKRSLQFLTLKEQLMMTQSNLMAIRCFRRSKLG